MRRAALLLAVACSDATQAPSPAPADAAVSPDTGLDGGLADAADAYTGKPPYYVDSVNAAASDSNPGTPTMPWKTMQRAAATLAAGDTVIIEPGTYTGTVVPAASGQPGAIITYQARPGAVLHGASFEITGKSYIKLDGLRVENVKDGDAIAVLGPGTDITISNNTVFDANGSCISAWGTAGNTDPTDPKLCPYGSFQCLENVVIENNLLDTCNNGGYDENLTIAQGVDHFTVRGNTLKDTGNADITNGGEGIDLKEGVTNGLVAHNTVLALGRNPGIYLDGGGYWSINPTPTTHDIVIDGNRLISESIRLNSEHQGNVARVTIQNNVVTGAPEDGIVVYQYPGSTGGMDGVTIENNTTYGNSTSNPYWFGVSLASAIATQVVIRNNIAFGNLGGQISAGSAVSDHNFTTDPSFVNAAGGDFHLQSSSPALGKGSPAGAPVLDFDGVARSATLPSIGAFEL